jgi:putative copper resistance protein D
MFLFGSSVFLRCFAAEPLRSFIARRLHGWMVASVALAVIAFLAWLPLAVADMADGWSEAVKPGVALGILWETVPGRVVLLRIGLVCLLVASFSVVSRFQLPALAASALLLVSFALSGHAVMDEGARGVIHQANDMVHVLAGAAWIGSLPALLSCLAVLRKPALCTQSRAALCSFSVAGHAAVALVLATGIVNALFVAGPPVNWLTHSPYHVLLLVKIVLVLSMVGLALANRYIWVPRLREFGETAIRAIRRRTFAELVLGGGVLGLVAVFGQLDPQ